MILKYLGDTSYGRRDEEHSITTIRDILQEFIDDGIRIQIGDVGSTEAKYFAVRKGDIKVSIRNSGALQALTHKYVTRNGRLSDEGLKKLNEIKSRLEKFGYKCSIRYFGNIQSVVVHKPMILEMRGASNHSRFKEKWENDKLLDLREMQETIQDILQEFTDDGLKIWVNRSQWDDSKIFKSPGINDIKVMFKGSESDMKKIRERLGKFGYKTIGPNHPPRGYQVILVKSNDKKINESRTSEMETIRDIIQEYIDDGMWVDILDPDTNRDKIVWKVLQDYLKNFQQVRVPDDSIIITCRGGEVKRTLDAQDIKRRLSKFGYHVSIYNANVTMVIVVTGSINESYGDEDGKIQEIKDNLQEFSDENIPLYIVREWDPMIRDFFGMGKDDILIRYGHRCDFEWQKKRRLEILQKIKERLDKFGYSTKFSPSPSIGIVVEF